MNELEQHILDQSVNNLSEEIDRGVYWLMLAEIGWTKVVLSKLIDNTQAVDISEWLEQHCVYDYISAGKEFIFEDKQDATMFILRWQ